MPRQAHRIIHYGKMSNNTDSLKLVSNQPVLCQTRRYGTTNKDPKSMWTLPPNKSHMWSPPLENNHVCCATHEVTNHPGNCVLPSTLIAKCDHIPGNWASHWYTKGYVYPRNIGVPYLSSYRNLNKYFYLFKASKLDHMSKKYIYIFKIHQTFNRNVC